MKIVFFLLITISFSFASNLSTLYKMYEKQEYQKGCDYGRKYLFKYKNIDNEKYLTLYGLSCLETDNIDRITLPIIHLKSTKSARENSSYFATILLQKQLLFQSLVDNKKLVDLHLPKTNFILSEIFNLFIEKKFIKKENIYRFNKTKRENIKYRLYLEEGKKSQKNMIVDIYKDDKFIKRHRYK